MGTRLFAPAKLTRTLRITGVRPDGYHLIDAEMVTLAWGDELDVVEHPAEEPSQLDVNGPWAAGVPRDASNLVAKALTLVGRAASVTITKNIPHGGGLGGGSADAAAILRWAGHADLTSAARLGADVPFCLAGGRARVTGIGERIEPLAHVDVAVTLVIPPLTVSTPAAYRAWDELGGPTGDGPNDLEAAALLVEPRLDLWRQRITEVCGVRPTLAGSGATWFIEGDHPALAEQLAGATVIRTRTGRR